MALLAKKRDEAGALLAARPLPKGEARWALEAREQAAAWLREAGAPGPRDEYWRFTNPATLVTPKPEAARVLVTDERPVFDAFDALRLVFVDGLFRPDLSDPLSMPGLVVQTLGEALATDIHWAREHFGQLEAHGQSPVPRPLAALNTAVAAEGIVLRVTGPAQRPLLIRYVHESETSDAYVRHLVKLDPGASVTMLESGPAAARFNKVMEVEVGDGAAFHHVRAQGRDHERRAVTHLFSRLGARAEYRSFTLTVNGRLTRNENVVEFAGDDSVGHIAGACLGDGDFHHDDTVFVTHGAERCESRQVFKKVLRRGAVGVFQGKILVRPGAQKTDGYQLSQGLLLDAASQFLAKPELEIYADDVKCSHGSTVGAVDETALFYLTSRGIPRAEAEDMLVLAFLDEAVQEIADPRLADDIRARLQGWTARRRRRV
ncbi:MAG TPA: Fe-S cluster assembly protein SufD [Paracoccaceae bacterium]|nr:Fe-S cluster assembly protein SufD [Paracoccaceae bacterium]